MEPRKIRKRDGSLEDFDINKPIEAMRHAFNEVGEEFPTGEKYQELYNCLAWDTDFSDTEDIPTVEEIQDIVEDILADCGYYDVLKAYIKYRYIHQLRRQNNNDATLLKLIRGEDEYWKTENSNKNAELVTVQRDYLAGATSTDLARNYIFPKDVIEAYDEGIVHQHDMDYMAQSTLTNCELINLEDMLQNGTVINNVRINKPHRLSTAMTIATQIMASVAANTYGGESITLTHLAPFVRDSKNIFIKKYRDAGLDEENVERLAKADLEKEIADAVQTFNYQISTLFTLNGQAPFCTVFMYLNETEEYREELILLIQEFLRQRLQGMPNRDGIKVTQAFPKLLYVLQEDNYKPGTTYWFLTKQAIECSSRRLTPDYISEKIMKRYKINGNGDGDCYACMGCRSFLTPDQTGNGFNNVSRAKNYEPGKPKYWGRFNCGVNSINLPDIAFASGGDYDKFWEIFDERMEILHRGLQTRIKRISNTKAKVAPILWMDGAMARLDPEDTLYDLVHGGYATISIGYTGLFECVYIMTGKSHTDPEATPFAKKVMQYLNDKASQWREEEDVAYSVYGSPAESLAYKFATKTRARYPEKFQELFGNKKYFENSYHIPSDEEIDPFTKIEFEGELQPLSPGGYIKILIQPPKTA